MNCSRILGKYRLQYDFDDLLLGNAEQYVGPLSMGLRVRRPLSVFFTSGALSIQLDNRAGLGLFRSIFVHVIVKFGIEFLAVQENFDLILPTLRVTLVNALLEKPEVASFKSLGSGISIRAPV